MPKCSLSRRQLTHMKIYMGLEHPHEAQQPIDMTFHVWENFQLEHQRPYREVGFDGERKIYQDKASESYVYDDGTEADEGLLIDNFLKANNIASWDDMVSEDAKKIAEENGCPESFLSETPFPA